jgi:hypothetical protein
MAKWSSDDYGSPAEDAASKAELEREARRRGLEPWQVEAARAVPDKLVADLVSDAYRSNPVTGGKSMAEKPQPKGTGWQTPSPLTPQPGINIIDDMCIADDQRQKLEQLAKMQEQLRKLRGE